MPRIALVEDDLVLADGLSQVFEAAGFDVALFPDGAQADSALGKDRFDLVVLDIGLPSLDGFSILERLRRVNKALPVLVLTARDAIQDRVHGFELGADDYLVKPFAIPELIARIKALLRRGQASKKLVLGPLVMEVDARRVWQAGEPLDLSTREWTVLEQLLSHAGRVVSKQEITQAIGGANARLSANAVEVYVSRLRGKLDASPIQIRTVHGFGYLLEMVE